MSVAYGGPVGGATMQPPGRVNFGWIGESFELFKANIGVWLVAGLMALIPSIVGGIIGAIQGAATAHNGTLTPTDSSSPFGGGRNPFASSLPPGESVLIQICSTVYSAWLYGGVYRTAVKQVRGEVISVGDIFSGAPLMLNMLGFQIVYGLLSVIGFLFCIVPGFLVAGLLFPGYALIADGESFGNTLSRCVDAMKRDMWNAAAFVFVMGLLIGVSALLCGLGLFVTVPMFYLTAALAYRDMIGMPGLNQGAAPYGTVPGAWPPAPGAWPPPPQTYDPAAPPAQQYPPPPAQQYPPPPAQQYPPPPAQQYPPPPAQQYPPFPPQSYPNPPEGTVPESGQYPQPPPPAPPFPPQSGQ